MSRIIGHVDELANGEVARFEEGHIWYARHSCGHIACYDSACTEQEVLGFAESPCYKCNWPYGTD